MKLNCPVCHTFIPVSQINVQADVAACAKCNEVFAVSDLVAEGQGDIECDLASPPQGAWFLDEGFAWTLGATTRSGLAFFLVPFMCVWSGFSLVGIYGTQIAAGEFRLAQSLFGIPFLLGTIFMGAGAIMS